MIVTVPIGLILISIGTSRASLLKSGKIKIKEKKPSAVNSGFKNYINFAGVATRTQYWRWVRFIILTQIGIFWYGAFSGIDTIYATILFQLAILIPTISVAVRRMHDAGKSGWFILVPFYNLYLLVQQSRSSL